MSTITYATLSEVLIANNDQKAFFEFVKKKCELSDALFACHRKFVNQFIINHTWRWKKSLYRKTTFYKKYGTWLKTKFELPEITFKDCVRKDFAECSVRTQKRRGEQLRHEKLPEEIELAYIENLRETDSVGAQIVKGISAASTETKEQILAILRQNVQLEVPYTPNEALALYVDLKCTRQKYELLQCQAKSRNSKLYPPYYKVSEAKKSCYPNGGIAITDVGVRIRLQCLLDHTVQRLIETCDDSLFADVDRIGLEMISKWGMDGASGQRLYKQIFEEDEDGSHSDGSVFMISLVPLTIKTANDELWTNPYSSSTRLCRPISFEFMKEKEESTVELYEDIEDQISELQATVVNVGKKQLKVRHKLSITMLDGKSTGYLTTTANCNCPICGATPKQMCNIEVIQSKEYNEVNYRFGLSSLHCWIRFLECILHIAFKQPIRKWKHSNEEELLEVKKKKNEIQLTFKTDKGLYLDFVRQGSGNSNDGNTARRFFRDPVYAAKNTGVDETLIRRFHVILIAITSRKPVDPVMFMQYATGTIRHYNTLYPWYYMPVTVHKVLFHGAQIMEFFDLPIGYYSEEAQEARNKDFKRIRECNTRKTSRVDTNTDIINGLLVSSDPVINTFRKVSEKKSMNFDAEVSALFLVDTEN